MRHTGQVALVLALQKLMKQPLPSSADTACSTWGAAEPHSEISGGVVRSLRVEMWENGGEEYSNMGHACVEMWEREEYSNIGTRAMEGGTFERTRTWGTEGGTFER